MKDKPFDAELAKWAKSAEVALLQYFRELGYDTVTHPHGIYGKDLECIGKNERFYVEVERRTQSTWRTGEFPYATVSIPRRRKADDGTFLFVVRYDLLSAVVVFPGDMKAASELAEKPNRLMATGEFFRNVPVFRCLRLDMADRRSESLAYRNREAFLARFNSPSFGFEIKSDMLSTFPPYGMSSEEWRSLLVATYKHLEDGMNDRLGGSNCPSMKRPRWWDDEWSDIVD